MRSFGLDIEMGLKDMGRLQTIASFKIILGILNFKDLELLKIEQVHLTACIRCDGFLPSLLMLWL